MSTCFFRHFSRTVSKLLQAPVIRDPIAESRYVTVDALRSRNVIRPTALRSGVW